MALNLDHMTVDGETVNFRDSSVSQQIAAGGFKKVNIYQTREAMINATPANNTDINIVLNDSVDNGDEVEY